MRSFLYAIVAYLMIIALGFAASYAIRAVSESRARDTASVMAARNRTPPFPYKTRTRKITCNVEVRKNGLLLMLR